jgi:hypothetical protein
MNAKGPVAGAFHGVAACRPLLRSVCWRGRTGLPDRPPGTSRVRLQRTIPVTRPASFGFGMRRPHRTPRIDTPARGDGRCSVLFSDGTSSS